MTIIQAIILGIIEGITEFLPVSSTGHMIIASSFMGIANEPFTKAFTVAIQFGAILAVLVIYWRRFIKSFEFYVKLFIAFIPSAVIGLLSIKIIDKLLGDVYVVATTLLIGGIILLFVDKWFEKSEEEPDKNITRKGAFIVGLYQVISMIPGVSRSAATIVGGLAGKLNRKNAAEFSFFLAVPTMFAATCYKLFKLYQAQGGMSGKEIHLLLLGNVLAFVIAIFAIKTFITYLTKHGFKLFGYYRIAMGLAIFIMGYWMGIKFQML